MVERLIALYPFLSHEREAVYWIVRAAVWQARGNSKEAWRIAVRDVTDLARALGWRRVRRGDRIVWVHERTLAEV